MSKTEEINDSTVRGLKIASDQSDKRFVRFFRIVQKSASDIGCTFFLWAGEGNELETESLDGEDLSGWLVPNNVADTFESKWLAGPDAIGDDYDDEFVFARWSDTPSGEIAITFEGLPS